MQLTLGRRQLVELGGLIVRRQQIFLISEPKSTALRPVGHVVSDTVAPHENLPKAKSLDASWQSQRTALEQAAGRLGIVELEVEAQQQAPIDQEDIRPRWALGNLPTSEMTP